MENAWRQILHRDPKANKYDFGHVLVVGGSDGMEGAPMLVAEAAMRIGAGLVTIASTHDVVERIAGEVEEVMTFAALSSDTDSSCERLLSFMQQRHVTTVVLGSGMAEEYHEFIRRFAKRVTVPIVIDAGALRALSQRPEDLRAITNHNKNCIFTPHSGEFADLLGKTDVSADDAEEFADEYQTTIVLKGNPTYVSTPGYMYENSTGTPALATAGTGDVLAGMIAGIAGQGMPSGEAAEMAVYAHGLAGKRAAVDKTEAGVMAHDVIDAIPLSLRSIANGDY